jgi:LytS/YehU family sensor histidine kinase
MNIPYFKNLMNRRRTWKARWQLCIIFSLFALMSNFKANKLKIIHNCQRAFHVRRRFIKFLKYGIFINTRWQLCIIFSLFALMSNLTGIVIDHQHSLSGSVYFRLDDDVSLANTRVLMHPPHPYTL